MSLPFPNAAHSHEQDADEQAELQHAAGDAEEQAFLDSDSIIRQVLVLDGNNDQPPDENLDDDDDDDAELDDHHDDDDDDADNHEEAGEDEDLQLVDDSELAFHDHTDSVYSIAVNSVHSDIVVSGGGDDRAFLWSSTDGMKAFELSGHTDSVVATGFNFDGSLVATGSLDGTIRVWQVEDGALLARLEGPDDAIEWLQWHPKGNVLVSGSADGSVWLWTVLGDDRSVCLQVLVGHSGSVSCGCFTPDGKQICTGGDDGSLRLWDPKTGRCLSTITDTPAQSFHKAGITSIECMPLARGSSSEAGGSSVASSASAEFAGVVLSGAQDGTSFLSNMTTARVLGSLPPHTDGVEHVSFASIPGFDFCATASLDGTLHVCDIKTLSLRSSCAHPQGVVKTAWHPTAPFVFSACLDGNVRLWDARTAQCVQTLHGHSDQLLALALQSDGSTLITGSDDHTARVFKVTLPQ